MSQNKSDIKINHNPVMIEQVLSGLQIKPNCNYIDCTVGEGGHTYSIINSCNPKPNILGIDLDSQALQKASKRLDSYNQKITLINDNFSNIEDIVNTHNFIPVDGVLFDLGLSSLQLETPNRGFSFKFDSFLDMRFNIHQELSAHQIINFSNEQELARIISEFGEQSRSKIIAKTIIRSRPINSTAQLAKIISHVLPYKKEHERIHPATKTFQAIRIAVNKELDNLTQMLNSLLNILNQGARIVGISYHSLEDRIIKQFFQKESTSCICPKTLPLCVCEHVPCLKILTKKIIIPTELEISLNPRSRSAKLRVAEVI